MIWYFIGWRKRDPLIVCRNISIWRFEHQLINIKSLWSLSKLVARPVGKVETPTALIVTSQDDPWWKEKFIFGTRVFE
jgi:hypothetical protein